MADHPPQLTGTKTCRICHQTKPVIAFACCKHTRDGLKHECRQCQSDHEKTTPSKRRQAEREAATRRARRNFNFRCNPSVLED